MSVSRLRALCIVLLTLAMPALGRAEPLVRVRAESRIELGVAHQALGMLISGALRDELGEPLAGRLLAVEAVMQDEPGDPWRIQLTTDESGRFSLELADPEHDYKLLATFAGDATHRGVRVERRVERARADVRLELRLPAGTLIDLDADELLVEAIAESDAGGAEIAMRLSDETGRVVATGMTDAGGHLALRVPSAEIGTPGPGLLRLESARDERRAEAQTEARIVRRRSLYVELRPEQREFEAGSLLRVRGAVHSKVAPRAAVPVGIFAENRHLETVVTDERGELTAELWLDAPPGPLKITARTEADATGAYPSAETSISVKIVPARPVPFPWMLAAAAVVGVALWVAARARVRSEEASGAVEPPLQPENLRSSVWPGRPQGKRDRQRIDGRVMDVRAGRAVADAVVQLLHEQASAACVVRTDELGKFGSGELPPGRLRLIVTADGYVATQTELELPHRGEWNGFEIKLESLRDRALSHFRRIALRLLPSPRAWGIWTSRETREWLTQRAAGQQTALGQLTQDVERACYAREVPSEAEVAHIEAAAKSLESDLPTGNIPQ